MERYVIKVGSSSITNQEIGLNQQIINKLAQQMSALYLAGSEVALVSSGAVAAGRFLLEDTEGKVDKQVAASFGQGEVTAAWSRALRKHGILAAQFLLTGNDLEYPKSSLEGALKRGIPVINANDTVNDREMTQYEIAADNDELSSFVTKEINASRLVLLTDVEGVLDACGKVISTISSTDDIEQLSFRQKSKTGTGGMQSKVTVAWRTARDKRLAWIANAHEDQVLLKIANGIQTGTLFYQKIGLELAQREHSLVSARIR